jgi:hypothetical protein
VLIATGARTIVSRVYLRNTGTAFGESGVLASLQKAGLSAELARCPVPGAPGDANWYRVKAAATQPGFLSVQRSCGGKPCEGFSVSYGTDLPALQPNQLRMYSEECGAGAAARKPVSTSMPHELLAQAFASLLPPATGLYDWAALQNSCRMQNGGRLIAQPADSRRSLRSGKSREESFTFWLAAH